MLIPEELRWIVSGATALAAILGVWQASLAGRKNTPRKLSKVIDQVRSSSLAIAQDSAFSAIIGMTVRFNERVLRARPSEGTLVVDFKICDIVVRCDFERACDIALTKEGEKWKVVGTIVRASRDLIEVKPLRDP